VHRFVHAPLQRSKVAQTKDVVASRASEAGLVEVLAVDLNALHHKGRLRCCFYFDFLGEGRGGGGGDLDTTKLVQQPQRQQQPHRTTRNHTGEKGKHRVRPFFTLQQTMQLSVGTTTLTERIGRFTAAWSAPSIFVPVFLLARAEPVWARRCVCGGGGGVGVELRTVATPQGLKRALKLESDQKKKKIFFF